MIIGIAGTLGAGKGTVVEYLKTRGFGHYSVSGHMTNMLHERGDAAIRANLSALADELAEQYTGGVLEVMQQKAASDGVTNYILESIHRVSEANYLRSIGAVILGVDADPKLRYERTLKRQEGEKDNVTFDEFMRSVEREEEGKGSGTPNINAVIADADFVLHNDGTIEDLHQQIDRFLAQHTDETH